MEPLRPRAALVGAFAIVTLIVAGCSSPEVADGDTATTSSPDTSTPDTTTAPLGVTFIDPPFPVGEADGARFVADVSCGDHERNVVDVLLPAEADAQDLVPWVVYLHGGGFTGGDKAGYWDPDGLGLGNPDVAAYLDAGVAVAAMNYRLIDPVDEDGVIKPMTDVGRCVQFVRHHAASTFGLDPERVVLTGGSAGAGTALWLGMHDDLADPDSDDPVARESTRPLAVAVIETQATYDLTRWVSDVFGDYSETFGDNTVVDLAEMLGQGQRLLSFFGVTSSAELQTPELVEYRSNVDMLGLMDADDVPFWVANVLTDEALPVDLDLFFHHPHHARALERRAQEVGLDATVIYGPDAEPVVTQHDFVLEALGVSQ